MNTEIQKVLTSHFGNMEIDVIQAGQQEPGITRKQLGEMLGYSDPQNAIDIIHRRKKERLDAVSVPVKMRGTDGKAYNTTIYGLKGVMEVCRYSNQPNADAVMDWAWEILDRLRKSELQPTNMSEDDLMNAGYAAALKLLEQERLRETIHQ